MDDRTVTVSISEDEEEFIARLMASGNYADEKELLHAGLAALERETKVRELRRLIAEGDADFLAGRVHSFKDAEELKRLVMSRVRQTSG